MAEHSPASPPYGPAIQEAIAKGDLVEMKAVAARAERFLEEVGDLSAALQFLKIEIARREAKSS